MMKANPKTTIERHRAHDGVAAARCARGLFGRLGEPRTDQVRATFDHDGSQPR